MRRNRRHCQIVAILSFVGMLGAASDSAQAAVIFGLNNDLTGGRRWDAAPRTFFISGNNEERSLDGGLRWNVQGGSMQAYRDLFDWSGPTPSVSAFEQAIHDSFDAWLVEDPNLGTTAPFHFVHDATSGTVSGAAGAEIDLLAGSTGQGVGVTGGLTNMFFQNSDATLTSGTTNYGTEVFRGADIRLNNLSTGSGDTSWNLSLFRRVLTHEIGHALGLGDVDHGGQVFLDDDYDGSSSATALASLTNVTSHLINPLDPSASAGLTLFEVPNTAVGIEAAGVHLLMESALDAAQLGFLTPDDFMGRQFLYPVVAAGMVPEPSSLALVGIFLLFGMAGSRKKLRKSC